MKSPITKNEYFNTFRPRVLAHTTGANIHVINGMLGVVLNSIDLVDDDCFSKKKQAEILQRMNDAIIRIRLMVPKSGI